MSNEEYLSFLSSSTLADIEDLDAQCYGFCRPECYDVDFEEMGKGFKSPIEHNFFFTNIPPSLWDPYGGNIPGFSDFQREVSNKEVAVSAFFAPNGSKGLGIHESESLVLRIFPHNEDERLVITQYTNFEDGSVPWESQQVLVSDRSKEVFIFVCSHRNRDKRCGYCGPVLVELFQRSISKYFGNDSPVYVFPCSHLGGHRYAGVVILYSSCHGISFGMFKPSDVDVLIKHLSEKKNGIPESLFSRVRGDMLF